jgi:hypothetical protein
MFQGSIPQAVRDMLHETVQGWHAQHYAVACSGNFTVERVLHQAGKPLISGCDVSIYTCALGAYFARSPFRLRLKDEYHERFAWLLPGLQTQAGGVATLMLLTSFAPAIKPTANAYYARLLDAYRRQWDALLDKTIQRLEAVPLRLHHFEIGDAVPWLETLPADVAVLSFPPFFAKGYEKMWAVHDQLFDWDKPAFAEIFEAHRTRFIVSLTQRREWLFMTSYEIPEYADHLRGMARTTLRGVPMYLYASSSPTRIAVPRQQVAPVNVPRLAPGDVLPEAAPVKLLPLSVPQFQAIRAQYLNAAIQVAGRNDGIGVLIDGKLVGVFAFRVGYAVPGAAADTMYLLTDFAVAPTDYPRLSKLVLYAALSREAQLIAERMARRRIRYIFTTAFSNNPVSMKYRGLFDLNNRKETPEATYHYALNYVAAAGQWSLAAGYAEWRKKHGDTKPT